MPVITVLPENIQLRANRGDNLLECLRAAGIAPEAPCGGRGKCGKCKAQMTVGATEATEADCMFFEEEAVGSLILTVPAAVLSLVSVYAEIQGHAEMMVGIDDELSTKWEQLWKLMMIAYSVLICSMVLILIIPPVGAIVTIAGAIAVLVAEIRKVVYLYRMDNTIRRLV